MKRMLAGLGATALLLGSLGGLGISQSILVLSEPCNRSRAYFPAALTGLGFQFTETSDDDGFFLALTQDGPWDLVIVDEYANLLGWDTVNALADYIDDGGRAYMNYWDWDEGIAAAFGALPGPNYFEPVPIYIWDETHPLFTTPNALRILEPATDMCDSDGAYFAALPGGVVVAGYTPDPAANQAAIIVGNEGRTVLFGGILGLFSGDENGNGREDGLEFAENVVAFLLAVPIVRPRPPLWTAISAADIDRLLSEMEISFEQLTSAEGDPVWALELAGATVGLLVFSPTGEGYQGLQLSATWPAPQRGAIPLINEWNLTRRGSRAYVNRAGEIALDADLYFVGGVSWRAVWAFIERFEQAITEFGVHLRQ